VIELGIYQLVTAGQSAAALAIQALIGTNFFPTVLPEDPTYPCASYQLIDDRAEYLLDGSTGIEVKRLQVDAWSGGTTNASFLAAKNTAQAIRALLSPKAGPPFSGRLPDGTFVNAILLLTARDEYEQDARAYRSRLEFRVFFNPSTEP
jgi:hypothetical protein